MHKNPEAYTKSAKFSAFAEFRQNEEIRYTDKNFLTSAGGDGRCCGKDGTEVHAESGYCLEGYIRPRY